MGAVPGTRVGTREAQRAIGPIRGVARHFNYMGEGFLSLSIALVFGHFANPWAWTYFVFIVTLFTFRQRDDDRHCAEKYGAEKWAEYQARVKYRISPASIERASCRVHPGRLFAAPGGVSPNRQD